MYSLILAFKLLRVSPGVNCRAWICLKWAHGYPADWEPQGLGKPEVGVWLPAYQERATTD
jgi:hypothetical protein